MNISEKIIKERRKLGLRQADLAEKIGVSTRSVNIYENGKAYPRRNVIEALAEVFGVTVDYLISDDEDESEGFARAKQFYLDEASEKFGAEAAAELETIVLSAESLFAGGKLFDDAREDYFEALMSSYLEAKTFYKDNGKE